MIRCRQCNSELIDQARFCNICGLPQKRQEPEQEHSTLKEETLETNSSSHCENCGAEISKEARFCAGCGTAQTSKKSPVLEVTSNDQVTPGSATNNKEVSTVHLKPKVAKKAAQAIIAVNEQHSIVSEKAPIQPKTVSRPPFFPSRPTSNNVKSSAATQQPTTPIPESSSESRVATTLIDKSGQEKMPEKAVSTAQPKNPNPDKDEPASNNSTQSLEEASAATRTPGLIRPVTSKSSSRSVIPTRPDSNGQTLSSPQSNKISKTPEYTTSSPPTNLSSPVKNQVKPPSSSALMQPEQESQNKQQIAQLATERTHIYSQPKVSGMSVQSRPKEPIVGSPAIPAEPLRKNSSTHDADELSMRNTSITYVQGRNSISDTPTMDLLNPASFMATSKAAEQWRKSWRDRQYAEAGPAENVSRGQASVPMPLTPMHQSFARMRAIRKHDKKQQNIRSAKLGTWITIFFMLCLIIGLGAYIIVSFMPNSPSATPPSNTTHPTLILEGTTSQTITIGHSIQLHGEHFGTNQTVVFLRDTAIPIIDKSGKNISTYTDNQGTFDITIPIDSKWSAGSHSIEAVDKSSNQNAFQTIQVMPAGTSTTTSTDLSISQKGKPVSLLAFETVIGQGNPVPQQITITNTSGSPLQWTATTSTNDNLNWLVINDNNNYGQLAISQPHSILISANTVGLKTTDTKHPYRGQIIFTINNTQLLTLPVQLLIDNTTPEMVFSPNPIIAQIGPGNTCQTGVTLTLINLGSAAISWTVKPDDNIQNNIKFVSNGRLLESGILLPAGSLLPSGQPGDTIVLTLQCYGIQSGRSYHISVYANKLSWSELVIVQ